jgi:predicted regulator of Ras-like GTPase activity (Roadblock/LC7/MglB family)
MPASAANRGREMLMAERSGAGTARDLDGVLADLRALSEDIESCAVLSGEGDLIFSSSHAPGVDRERVGAILAALVNLSERLARESGKGHFSQLRIDTGGGHLLVVRLDGGGVLAATTGQEARVGLVLYDMRNSRGEVEKVLAEGSDE